MKLVRYVKKRDPRVRLYRQQQREREARQQEEERAQKAQLVGLGRMSSRAGIN